MKCSLKNVINYFMEYFKICLKNERIVLISLTLLIDIYKLVLALEKKNPAGQEFFKKGCVYVCQLSNTWDIGAKGNT